VAQTAAQARSEPEASTMHRLRLLQRSLDKAADAEAFERLKRLSSVSYDDVLKRVAYGTPDAVVERLQQYRDDLGLTGFALEINPGGQIPYERVVAALRLLAEKVIPKFK
jgi:alkanesulfonate monooxygenase SsuD/methylene tetrahydromethanopterin reductase-like flavin-dependent oxidoreductase (luciferase family)